jgi:hypothetical protein
MDQKSSKSVFKSVSIKAFLATFFIMLASASFTGATEIGLSNETGVTITSTGVVNGEMVFTLKYDNEHADVLEIAITDNQGNRLYRKLSSDKKLSTTFKVPADLGTVYLTVTNAKDKTQKRFQISAQERVVEKVVIGSVR